jgi:hypothetical protein
MSDDRVHGVFCGLRDNCDSPFRYPPIDFRRVGGGPRSRPQARAIGACLAEAVLATSSEAANRSDGRRGATYASGEVR